MNRNAKERDHNEYRRLILKYEKKRKVLKDKLQSIKSSMKPYSKQLAVVRNRLGTWKRAFKRTTKQREIMNAASDYVYRFIGVSPRYIGSRKTNAIESKVLFYRYCRSHKVRIGYIAEFCKVHRSTPLRTLKAYEGKLDDLWRRFTAFAERRKQLDDERKRIGLW